MTTGRTTALQRSKPHMPDLLLEPDTINFGDLPEGIDALLQQGVAAYRHDRSRADRLFRQALAAARPSCRSTSASIRFTLIRAISTKRRLRPRAASRKRRARPDGTRIGANGGPRPCCPKAPGASRSIPSRRLPLFICAKTTPTKQARFSKGCGSWIPPARSDGRSSRRWRRASAEAKGSDGISLAQEPWNARQRRRHVEPNTSDGSGGTRCKRLEEQQNCERPRAGVQACRRPCHELSARRHIVSMSTSEN